MSEGDRVVIYTIAEVPADLSKAWLQHLRDFDTAHPGCHFQVLEDAPEKSFNEMLADLVVNPGLPLQAVIRRGAAANPCPHWPGCGCGTQGGPPTCEWEWNRK